MRAGRRASMNSSPPTSATSTRAGPTAKIRTPNSPLALFAWQRDDALAPDERREVGKEAPARVEVVRRRTGFDERSTFPVLADRLVILIGANRREHDRRRGRIGPQALVGEPFPTFEASSLRPRSGLRSFPRDRYCVRLP